MRLLLIALPLALAACASPLADKAERARMQMLGFTADQLQACAGQPTATNRENGAEIWSYFRETSRSATASSPVGYTPTNRGETSYDYFRYCEAVFLFQQGRVREIDFRGRTSTGRQTLEPCGAIVQRCVTP